MSDITLILQTVEQSPSKKIQRTNTEISLTCAAKTLSGCKDQTVFMVHFYDQKLTVWSRCQMVGLGWAVMGFPV